MNRKTLVIVGAVVLAIPALALAYWLFSPLFITDEVNEEFPYARQAVLPDGMSRQEAESQMATAANVDSVEMQEDMEEQTALKVLAGEFEGADSFHRGSGDAFVFALPDGANVLRLEDFNVTNGPDLHVYLSPDGSTSNAVDLGMLKGNVGNQNYDIPPDFDAASATRVIIYCVPFRVTFATADLSVPQ